MTVFSRCSGSFVGFAREMPMCEPPRKWMRLTSSIVSGRDVVDVALHDPLEAVADAQDLDTLEDAADRRRADDAVDAGGGAAPDENGESLLMAHGLHLGSRSEPRRRKYSARPEGRARSV